MFSPGFIKWLSGNTLGNSVGNGAMMRISPVGYMFNTEEDVIENCKLATIPSHNTKEAIDSATMIALIIYYARKGLNKEEIINELKEICRVKLAEYEQPVEFIIKDELPLTSIGKIDSFKLKQEQYDKAALVRKRK